MNKSDAKALAKSRRRDMPVYAGRGAGPHKSKAHYSRKVKHKGQAVR